MNEVNIDFVKNKNKAAGRCFFKRGTMRFFRSRTSQTAALCDDGRAFFVTSEQFVLSQGRPGPRLYTVRVMAPSGNVSTFGEFQGYETSKAAWAAIAREVDK